MKSNDWIKINNGNVIIKDFQEIRDDILEELIKINELKYKVKTNEDKVEERNIEVENFPKYSSDYIFVNNIALAIWNNLKSINNLYDIHRIEYAKDKYLDKIMAFYGYNRSQEKVYVLEVTFEYDDEKDKNILEVLSKKTYLDLIRENTSTTLYSTNMGDEIYEFNLYKEVITPDKENRKEDKKYITFWIKAKRYYEGLTFDKVRNLKLQFEDLNVHSSSEYKIKIIGIQKRKESDEEFRQHLLNHDKNNRDILIEELEKVENIQSVEIINSNENYDSIQNGQILILLERNEHVKYENEDKSLTDEGINLKNEIESSINEFLPMGFQTVLLSNEKNTNEKKYLQEVSSLTSKNDFIVQKIKYSFVKQTHTILSFQAIDVKKEDIPSLCEDLIEKINSKSVLFTLQKDILWNIIKPLFDIKDNKIYLYKNVFNNEPSFTKFTNISYDNIDTLSPLGIKVNGDKVMQEYTADNTNLKFRPTFSDYKYKFNKDGSFLIIIY